MLVIPILEVTLDLSHPHLLVVIHLNLPRMGRRFQAVLDQPAEDDLSGRLLQAPQGHIFVLEECPGDSVIVHIAVGRNIVPLDPLGHLDHQLHTAVALRVFC